MPSFGARLRAQREERDIPLSQIAYDTKIKLTLLEGLERDDVSCWPQGLFRRAWVRSYARAIGLDPEATVREFVALYPDPAEQLPEPEPEPTGLQKALAIAMMGSRPLPKPSRTALIARMVAATQEGPKGNGTEVRGSEGPKVEVAEITEPEVVATPVVEEPLNLGTDRPSDPRTFGPSDLCTLAQLCARVAAAPDWAGLTPALAEAASLMQAEGMTIWTWDQRSNALSPAWAHGYADELVARMPRVTRDSDNALAAAWREARVVVVSATPGATGAVVAPMVTPDGCFGVVALELTETREADQLIQAMATILAAQLASVMGVEACYTGIASESRAS